MMFLYAAPASFEMTESDSPAGSADFLGGQRDDLVLLNRTHRVLGRHVRDFVAEHAGKLRFVLDQAEQAAGHMNDAAGRRERVHTVGVEDDELPVQVRTRAALRQHLADERHILRDVLVLIDAEVLAQFRAHVFAELSFVRVGDPDFGGLFVEVVFGFLRLFHPIAQAAELRVRRYRAANDTHECQCYGEFHVL